MHYLADEIMEIVDARCKDQSDLDKLIGYMKTFRKEHSFLAGTAEAVIGITSIAAGASLINPVGCGDKIPELIGALAGCGIGGVAGTVVSVVGGIGIAMMGTAFSIPVAAITAFGACIGGLSGMITGWFGVELATHSESFLELFASNVSGLALIAFGCYMLFLAMKDLWRAGGEFISYLKDRRAEEFTVEVLS